MAVGDWDEQTEHSALDLLDLVHDPSVTGVYIHGTEPVVYKRNGEKLRAERTSFPSTELLRDVVNELFASSPDLEENQSLGNLPPGAEPRAEEVGPDTGMFETYVELPNLDDPEGPSVKLRLHSLWPPYLPEAYITIEKKVGNAPATYRGIVGATT